MKGKYKVFVLPAAREEISMAARWYRSQQKGLDKRFRSAVRESLMRISAQPKIGSSPYEDVSWVAVSRFPYQIHYYVNDADMAIIVLRVYATSREPFWEE